LFGFNLNLSHNIFALQTFFNLGCTLQRIKKICTLCQDPYAEETSFHTEIFLLFKQTSRLVLFYNKLIHRVDPSFRKIIAVGDLMFLGMQDLDFVQI